MGYPKSRKILKLKNLRIESVTIFLSDLLCAHLVGKDAVWTKGIWKDSSSEQPDLNIEHSETKMVIFLILKAIGTFQLSLIELEV